MGRAFTILGWLMVAVFVLPFAFVLVKTAGELVAGDEAPLSPGQFLFLAAFILIFVGPAVWALVRRGRRPAPEPPTGDLLTHIRERQAGLPRISLWKARPFLPAPYGTRTGDDAPACPTCGAPAEDVQIAPGTITLLPCRHGMRVRNLPPAAYS